MSNELKKVLAGKDVKMHTFVSKTEDGFQGASSRAGLETAMQLLQVFMTQNAPQRTLALRYGTTFSSGLNMLFYDNLLALMQVDALGGRLSI